MNRSTRNGVNSRSPSESREGFTLVEMIVVVFIIALLAALLLPAIMRARSAARRTECMSNIRELAMAFREYESQNGTLPNSGTFQTFADVGLPGGNRLFWGGPLHSWVVDILPFIEQPGIERRWVAAAGFDSESPLAVSNEAIGNESLSRTPIPALVCPTDPTIRPGWGNLSYAVNGGFTLHGHCPRSGLSGKGPWMDWDGNGVVASGCSGTELANPGVQGDRQAAWNMGLLFPGTAHHATIDELQGGRTMASIRDGTSQTILLAENLHTGYAVYTWQEAGKNVDSTWANPDPSFAAFRASDDVCPQGDCTRIRWDLANSNAATDNPVGAPEKINGYFGGGLIGSYGVIWPYPTSLHGGGVNIAMCDGSTRFLNEKIDGATYAKLITPSASTNVPRSWPAYQPPLSGGF